MRKEFATKLKSKDKTGKVIVVAIMRKLLHIIFGIIKQKTQYDNGTKIFINVAHYGSMLLSCIVDNT